MSILQDLYDEEINVKVTSFWDGGFKGWLGDDEYNGLSEEVEAYTFAELEFELQKLAIKLYPGLAGKWKELNKKSLEKGNQGT